MSGLTIQLEPALFPRRSKWCGWQELNLRHLLIETSALFTELQPLDILPGRANPGVVWDYYRERRTAWLAYIAAPVNAAVKIWYQKEDALV